MNKQEATIEFYKHLIPLAEKLADLFVKQRLNLVDRQLEVLRKEIEVMDNTVVRIFDMGTPIIASLIQKELNDHAKKEKKK